MIQRVSTAAMGLKPKVISISPEPLATTGSAAWMGRVAERRRTSAGLAKWWSFMMGGEDGLALGGFNWNRGVIFK